MSNKGLARYYRDYLGGSVLTFICHVLEGDINSMHANVLKYLAISLKPLNQEP